MGDVLHVASRKGLFTWRRSAAGWELVERDFLGIPVSMVLRDARDDTLYAALAHGHFGVKLHKKPAGGSWRECVAPAYPPRPETEEEPGSPIDERGGSPEEWSVQLLWALEAGGPDEAGVLWAGTIPGGLFRSEDGGESWSLNEPLWLREERKEWFGGGYDDAGIHSISLDPRDPRRMLVGVSCGGVWITEDGGESWEQRSSGMHADYMPPDRREDPNIQDPHRLVRCTAAPESLWVQHHNGVFRSTDEGESWREVEDVPPSVFGFACAVHPDDPETAWTVPAVKDSCRIPVDGRMVVTRTRDGGKSFEVLREGLPPSETYHLVYRHGLDVSADGDRLAMGSTTGGLWISEDQGDSWSCLSLGLPPIYTVRFA